MELPHGGRASLNLSLVWGNSNPVTLLWARAQCLTCVSVFEGSLSTLGLYLAEWVGFNPRGGVNFTLAQGLSALTIGDR